MFLFYVSLQYPLCNLWNCYNEDRSHVESIFTKDREIAHADDTVIQDNHSIPDTNDNGTSGRIHRQGVPTQVTRAFAAIDDVVIADNSSLNKEDVQHLVPEMQNKIVNTRILSEQVQAANEQHQAGIAYRYEMMSGGGYNIVVYATDTQNATSQESTDADAASFRLNDLLVDAGEGLPKDNDELGKIKERYVGRDVDMQDLHAAVNEVTGYYRSHGYPAATAYLPSQESEDNVIHIGVEPGRYGNINIDNQSHIKNHIIEGK